MENNTLKSLAIICLFNGDNFNNGISLNLNKILVARHDFNQDILRLGTIIQLKSGGVCEISRVKDSKIFIELKVVGCNLTREDEFPNVFNILEQKQLETLEF